MERSWGVEGNEVVIEYCFGRQKILSTANQMLQELLVSHTSIECVPACHVLIYVYTCVDLQIQIAPILPFHAELSLTPQSTTLARC